MRKVANPEIWLYHNVQHISVWQKFGPICFGALCSTCAPLPIHNSPGWDYSIRAVRHPLSVPPMAKDLIPLAKCVIFHLWTFAWMPQERFRTVPGASSELPRDSFEGFSHPVTGSALQEHGVKGQAEADPAGSWHFWKRLWPLLPGPVQVWEAKVEFQGEGEAGCRVRADEGFWVALVKAIGSRLLFLGPFQQSLSDIECLTTNTL